MYEGMTMLAALAVCDTHTYAHARTHTHIGSNGKARWIAQPIRSGG